MPFTQFVDINLIGIQLSWSSCHHRFPGSAELCLLKYDQQNHDLLLWNTCHLTTVKSKDCIEFCLCIYNLQDVKYRSSIIHMSISLISHLNKSIVYSMRL